MPITTKNKDKKNVVQSNCFLILKVREGGKTMKEFSYHLSNNDNTQPRVSLSHYGSTSHEHNNVLI